MIGVWSIRSFGRSRINFSREHRRAQEPCGWRRRWARPPQFAQVDGIASERVATPVRLRPRAWAPNRIGTGIRRRNCCDFLVEGSSSRRRLRPHTGGAVLASLTRSFRCQPPNSAHQRQQETRDHDPQAWRDDIASDVKNQIDSWAGTDRLGPNRETELARPIDGECPQRARQFRGLGTNANLGSLVRRVVVLGRPAYRKAFFPYRLSIPCQYGAIAVWIGPSAMRIEIKCGGDHESDWVHFG